MAEHESADARIPCPLCGGSIHPIAGRCKHCKGDVAAARGRRPQAQAALPAIIAHSSQATFRPADAPGPTGDAPPILPPRPTGRMMVARPRPRWPLVVIGVSVVAIAGSVTAIVMTSSSKPATAAVPKRAATTSADAGVAPEVAAPVAPTPAGDVRPPRAADLAAYTKDIPGSGALRARIETSMGTITCELFEDKTPATVANFVGLATGKKPWRDEQGNVVVDKPFYDGLIFHRVIENFMIQGGDPQGTGRGGPGYQFPDETHPDITFKAGSLAMANAGPDTNGSQFFITEIAPSWLTAKHTIFGQCEPLYVVSQIARVPQDDMNKPDADVVIRRVRFERR